ncbi:Txe/YoeB family addiction module toxin [Megasphaera elsdenii]
MVRKLKKLINGLYENPFYHAEKLEPKWKNRYSLRINIQHRLVYNVNIDEQKIKLLSCWTHYE